MEEEHFEEFSQLITGIYRNIQKAKDHRGAEVGMKAVHVFWVYLLRRHPEGLTASELSRYSQTNRSLVSREINELVSLGYVQTDRQSDRRRYGWKFILTDLGMKAAEQIGKISLEIQNQVNTGISAEDLAVFYRTSKQLLANFDRIFAKLTEETSCQ